jgi:hypothetical protein
VRLGVIGLVNQLAWSPGDRRALEALIHDWRFETRQARGIAGRVLISGRWSFALALTLARIALRDMRRIDNWRPVAFGLALASVLSILWVFVWGPNPRGRLDLASMMWLSPANAAAFMAPALAVTLSWTRRAALLGVGAVTATAMVMMLGWIVPESNHQFRERMHVALSLDGFTSQLSRGLSELTLPSLIGRLATDEGVGQARTHLINRVALMLWALAGVLLGLSIASHRKEERAWWCAATALAAVALVVMASALTLRLARLLFDSIPGGASVWVMTAWSVAAALLISRSAPAAPTPADQQSSSS